MSEPFGRKVWLIRQILIEIKDLVFSQLFGLSTLQPNNETIRAINGKQRKQKSFGFKGICVKSSVNKKFYLFFKNQKSVKEFRFAKALFDNRSESEGLSQDMNTQLNIYSLFRRIRI